MGRLPSDDGIDIISMDGLTFKRALELCACLDRQAVALQDNDGRSPGEVRSSVGHLLANGKRAMLVSDPANGKTLEPQICSVNDDELLRRVLQRSDRADPETWMTNNKTEWALRLLDADESITFPDAMKERGLPLPVAVPRVHARGVYVIYDDGRPLVEAYDGPQIVGMDLHRRRSVLVRMSEDGGELGTARITNSPARLAAEIARAGLHPKVVLEACYGWYWAADTLAAARGGAPGAPAGGEGLRLPPGQER